MVGSAPLSSISEPHKDAVKSLSHDVKDADVSFVRGLLKSVDTHANKVSYEHISENPDVPSEVAEMSFDVLVLATGAQYVAPWRDGLPVDQWQSNA